MNGASNSEVEPVDHVGLVFRALGFGAALGVAFQALVTGTVRTLQGPTPPEAPSLSSGPALVLLFGTLAGIVVAGAATGKVLGPLRNPWRQAMFGMIAGLGSFVLSLVTIPIDRALGRSGLLGLAFVSGVVCVSIGRRFAERQRRPTPE